MPVARPSQAAHAFGFQFCLIGRPALVALAMQELQITPGKQPRIVAIIENDLDGIVADRLQVFDFDVLLFPNGHPLFG